MSLATSIHRCLLLKTLSTTFPSLGTSSFSDMTDLILFNNAGSTKILQNLNPKKGSGPDAIQCYVLKEAVTQIAPHTFPLSLRFGQFPADWLIANVTLVIKNGKRHDPANNHPVALMSAVCKSMEQILYKSFIAHLEEYNILMAYQHGFRKGRSCETQSLITLEDIAKQLPTPAGYIGITTASEAILSPG